MCVYPKWRREQEFDMQLLDRAVQGEEWSVEPTERQRSHSDEWLTLHSNPSRELDLEPLDYQLDLSKEVPLYLNLSTTHTFSYLLICSLWDE